jgi:hypothetical protein
MTSVLHRSFLAFCGWLVHVFPARPREYGKTPLVSRTVVATAVLSGTKLHTNNRRHWRVCWAFGHTLVIGENRVPADLSGGLTRVQNVSLCGKKRELDNSVLATQFIILWTAAGLVSEAFLHSESQIRVTTVQQKVLKYTDNLE